MKGELFHPLPLPWLLPQSRRWSQERGKETRFVWMYHVLLVLNCTREMDTGCLALPPMGKKMPPPFHSLSQIKSFQSSAAALVIIRGASTSATWLKQSSCISCALSPPQSCFTPHRLQVDNLVLLYYCPSYFLSVFIIIHTYFIHFFFLTNSFSFGLFAFRRAKTYRNTASFSFLG